MKNKIKISKPFIEECNYSDIFGESIKLCAKITMKNPNTNKIETKTCYFEFEKKYKKYLCNERSDAFVMGLLTTAMENNMDIEFESPISERLYYQLVTYYIPMVSKYNASYPMYNIELKGPCDNTIIKNENAIVTGCSGGVDSFYTIAHYTNNNISNNYKLTHIVYNSSASSDIVKDRMINIYKKTLIKMRKIALDSKLDIIACYNNLYEFYKFPFKGFTMFYTTIFSSVAYVLQKLISIYYVSSGSSTSSFNIDIRKTDGNDASAFDIFTTQCLNSENLSFYSTGMEVERIDKEEYISNYNSAQKNLLVCNSYMFNNNDKEIKNCSECSKCLRTISHFYALGKLKKFENVFDIEKFYKNKSKYLGKVLSSDKSNFTDELINKCKKNNVKIPITSYFYSYLWYRPINFLRRLFKNSSIIRKLYYKLNLDYKINGFRGPEYEYYKDKLSKHEKNVK